MDMYLTHEAKIAERNCQNFNFGRGRSRDKVCVAMTELDEILTVLTGQVDGSVAAAVAGMDGLVIEQAGGMRSELAAFVAEMTNVLTSGTGALSGRLKGGPLQEVILSAELYVAYVRILSADLYCVLLLDAGGNIGKARLYSDYAGKRILEALA